jgi:hypothetical protein
MPQIAGNYRPLNPTLILGSFGFTPHTSAFVFQGTFWVSTIFEGCIYVIDFEPTILVIIFKSAITVH